ncbi:MAG: c-type cytochrome [Actinomycetota bacterium]|nr:c-type cytochrome [Actinomycetota bacterium]
MRRTALVLAALTLVLAVGVAAGCGGEEEATPTPDTITGTVTTDTTETETTETETTETETTETTGTGTETTETTDTAPAAGGDPAAGKEVFLGVGGCGSCHTLADAGTSGSIGPNLDDAAPSLDLALDRITNGQGAMPAFSDQLTEQQIADVAAYVSGA